MNDNILILEYLWMQNIVFYVNFGFQNKLVKFGEYRMGSTWSIQF